MSPIKQEYNSSVKRHMLTNQKVCGSIPSQVKKRPIFCELLELHFLDLIELTI